MAIGVGQKTIKKKTGFIKLWIPMGNFAAFPFAKSKHSPWWYGGIVTAPSADPRCTGAQVLYAIALVEVEIDFFWGLQFCLKETYMLLLLGKFSHSKYILFAKSFPAHGFSPKFFLQIDMIFEEVLPGLSRCFRSYGGSVFFWYLFGGHNFVCYWSVRMITYNLVNSLCEKNHQKDMKSKV